MKKFITAIVLLSLILLFLLWLSLGIEGVQLFFGVALLVIVFIILLIKWAEFINKMEDYKTSIFERLKICWYVLTKKYYFYVGMDEDSIIWDEKDKYLGLKESSLKCYNYISKDYQFLAHDKKTNLHDFVLRVIVKFINDKLIKE